MQLYGGIGRNLLFMDEGSVSRTQVRQNQVIFLEAQLAVPVADTFCLSWETDLAGGIPANHGDRIAQGVKLSVSGYQLVFAEKVLNSEPFFLCFLSAFFLFYPLAIFFFRMIIKTTTAAMTTTAAATPATIIQVLE